MRYLSVCSGIEAATAAWHTLGWTPVAFSEIEKFPSAVLAHHYPDTPNWGDLTRFKEWPDATVDVLVGGTPCQSFSVAGLRKGLEDPRGNLALTFLALAERYRPTWIVWENVPGVLSSSGGRDFGSFLGGLVELGYGFAYRVLDAQYFGVAQRRRRVFVVGHLGDWRRAAAVLLEPESLRGDSAPCRKAGEGVAERVKDGPGDCRWPALTASTLNAAFGDKQGLEDQRALGGASLFVPDYVNSLTAHNGARNEVSDILNGAVVSFHSRQDPITNGECPLPLEAKGGQAVAFDTTQITSKANRSNPQPGDPCHPICAGAHAPAVAFAQNQLGEVRTGAVLNTLNTNSNASGRNTPMVQTSMQVRRLTPIECERLQGFPDNYTSIPYRGKPAEQCPDGPRYKALGNSMAVPVMAWIGKRIQEAL